MRNRTIAVLTLLLWLVSARITEGQSTIQTIAGGGPNNLPALQSSLGYPTGIAWDAAGNLYVLDSDSQRVLKKDTSGNITVAAGSGVWGFADGPTLNAQFAAEGNIAIDSSGNILIADSQNCRIRKVDTSGNTTTIAGTGTCGYSGDGPALSVSISSPQSVFVDASGNLFIAEIDNCIIRKLSVNTGILTTVAGTPLACGYSGDGARATNATLNFPWSVAVDGSGNIFIADLGNAVIREVLATTGNITTVAGKFSLGPGYSGDNGPATNAQLNWPLSIALDASGDLFIADLNNNAVREVTAAGDISTVAGMPCTNCDGIVDSGDGGPATQAQIGFPLVVAISGSGDLLIGTTEGLIRDVSSGTITTLAGATRVDPETEATVGLPTLSGDTDPALQASIEYPLGLATDNSGNIFIADSSAAIREINASTGIITTVAGTGISGSSGDGGAAVNAKLSLPSGVAVDGHGNLFVADSFNCVVREVLATPGTIQTVAGMMNSCGYSGDGGAATRAQLSEMSGISLDSVGNIFIADSFNYVIREVTVADGNIHTVAGNGVLGNSGDGGPATSAELNPWSVLVDGSGNIFIADSSNCAVREVTAADGNIHTIAGTNGVCGFSGNGGPATQAQLGILSSQMYMDAGGNLFIPDFGNAVVWELNAGTGNINQVVGNGTYGFSGDGGPALSAELSWPTAAGADKSGNLLVLDGLRVRSVNGLVQTQPKAQATISPAFIAFQTQPVGTSAPPRSITVSNLSNASVTISTLSINGSNKSDFQESDNCSGGTLTPGGSCAVQVTFTASSPGNESAVLTVGSSSGAQTASLVGAGADFVITASSGGSTSAAVNAGETAEYPLQLTTFGGAAPIARSALQNGNRTLVIPVTITCSGAPVGATCNVSPTIPVAIGTEVPFTVSVNTTARQNTAAGIHEENLLWPTPEVPRPWKRWDMVALFLLAGLTFMLPVCARRRVMRFVLALGLVSVGLGCGTSPTVTSPHSLTAGTAPGTYTLNVTATSGKDSHTTQLTLTVR